MATFRVNKNKNYTVMSNIHLKDPRISLKCKGLLSIMLSLPEEWDYTIRGLASIMKDGESAISAALKELETFGYLTRERQRDENGHVKNIEYNIFEEPIDFDPDNPYPEPPNHSNSPKGENPAQENHPPASQKSKGRKSPKTSMAKGKNQNLSFAKKETEILDLPKQENQGQVNPVQENPVEENRRQINTKTINTKTINTNGSSTYPSNPIHQEPRMDEMGLDWIGQKREEIKNQIEFETLKGQYNEKTLNEIVQIMLDVFVGQKPEIMISGTTYPTAYVQDRLMQIDSMHIQYIFYCLDENPTEIRNIKKYLLAVLFSAPTTIDSYYSAKVRHDLCCGW